MSSTEKKTISEVRKAREQSESLAKKQPSTPHLQKKRNLQDYIDYSLDLPFECSSVTHIDDDAHYVLSLIKKKKDGVRIGRLVSALIKDFFEEHQTEIKEIVKKNKYL